MKIAKVQMPDGRIGKFEVPESATEEQVMSFVNNKKFDDNDVPEWGRENPNLYGAYGAIKGVADTVSDTAKLATTMVKNTPRDLYDFTETTGEAFLHPIQTADTFAKLGTGAVEKLIPGEQGSEKYFDEVYGQAKNAVGSLSALNKTLGAHPVYAASMFPVAGSALGGATMTAGKIAKTPALMKKGAAMVEQSSKLDPLSIASRATSKVASGVKNLGAELHGSVTGSGGEAIKQAFSNRGDRFIKAMRGEIPFDETVTRAKGALGEIKRQRGIKIQNSLAEISRDNKINIDLRPIKTKLSNIMKEYNIRVIDTPEGRKLDFSRSRIDRNARGDVASIINDVSSWGTQAGDTSPAGLHQLKMLLDDFYSDTKNSRALVTGLRNEVKNTLVAKIPEYATAMDEYSKTTKVLNEIEKALSLNDRTMMDTSFKKLISTNRENFEFRKMLRNELEKSSGIDLSGEIAGHAMNQVIPKGLVGKIAAGTTGVAAMSSPWVLASLPIMSPRIMGEFLHFLGYSKNSVNQVYSAIRKSKIFGVGKRNTAAFTELARENSHRQNETSPRGINQSGRKLTQ